MKIFISSIIDLENSASSRLHNLVDYLVAQKHEVAVLSIEDHWKKKQSQKTADTFAGTLAKIKIYHPFKKEISPVFQEYFSFLSVSKVLEKIEAEKYQVHFNYNSLMLGYQTAKWFKKHGIKTVFDLADDLPAMAKDSPQVSALMKPAAYSISKRLVNRNINIADKVTLTCEPLAEDLKVPKSKRVIIPNGVSINRFARKDGKKIPDKITLGYVGVLREWVNFAPVFAALKENPNINLKIAGKEGEFEKLKSTAESLGIKSQVEFVGSIPYSEVPKFLHSVDAGILPFNHSLISKNAFPLKMLEYAAAGLPIISTKLPAVTDIFESNIIYAKNEREWGEALASIKSNYAKWQKNIEKLQPQIAEYDWRNICEQFEELLTEEKK